MCIKTQKHMVINSVNADLKILTNKQLSVLVASSFSLNFNNFWKDFSKVIYIPAAFFSAHSSPKLRNAIDKVLFVLWLDFTTYVLHLVPQILNWIAIRGLRGGGGGLPPGYFVFFKEFFG